MNHVARRIGRSLALVLPVVLVLSGTLAVARVPWASAPADSQALTASADGASTQQTEPRTPRTPRTPQAALRDRLVAELQQENPGVALTSLQKEMNRKPSLARHCKAIAKALGRAAVEKYGVGHRAQAFARPVCDTAFATGVAQLS